MPRVSAKYAAMTVRSSGDRGVGVGSEGEGRAFRRAQEYRVDVPRGREPGRSPAPGQVMSRAETYAVKLEPQPHPPVALGLLNVNPLPIIPVT